MKGKVFFGTVLWVVWLGTFSYVFSDKTGIYDTDVLNSNPDLIQQEPWQGKTEKASSQVQKSDVMGVYDFEGGGRVEQASSVQADGSDSAFGRGSGTDNKRGAKRGVSGNKADEGNESGQKSKSSFSDVAAQVNATGSKPKKSLSTLKAYSKAESRLFDFDDERNPEMPDIMTVVSDNVKPSISPE